MENAEIRGPEFRNVNNNEAGVSATLNHQLNTEIMAKNLPLPVHQDGSISSNTNCQFNPYESVTSAYNTNDLVVKDSTQGGAKTTSITVVATTNNEAVMTKN